MTPKAPASKGVASKGGAANGSANAAPAEAETAMFNVHRLPSAPRRVLFVSSSGGHLSQLLQLRPWWAHHERRWVTFDLPDAHSKLKGEHLIPAHHPTTRNIPNALRNMVLANKVLSEWRPDVVISNGAGVAVPFFVAAKTRNIPTVYLEVYDRIDSRTMTGRLVRPFTSRFCVQWPEQERLNPGSELVGPLY